MRISDWSSDWCSSDLMQAGPIADAAVAASDQRDLATQIGNIVGTPGHPQTPRQRVAGNHSRMRDRINETRPPSAPSCRRQADDRRPAQNGSRSEEHTSELQSLMRISYAVF